MDASLRVGLNAKAAVQVSSIPDALVVPYECVLQDEEGDEYVYAYADGRAAPTGFRVRGGVEHRIPCGVRVTDRGSDYPGSREGVGGRRARCHPGGGCRMRDILLCAFRNLSRKWSRTLLTVSGITVGVAMVAIVSMIASLGRQAVDAELDSLASTACL